MFIILTLFISPCLTSKGLSEIDFELENAETKIMNAFRALRAAESKGADVSALVSKLNDAIILLEEAKTSYLNGSVDDVQMRARESSLISSGIETEAKALTEQALRNAEEDFRMLSIYTMTAALATILVLLFVWRIFKAHYARRILEAKPEVVEDEP